VSIAQQSAMPQVTARSRHTHALKLVPEVQRNRTLLKIAFLVSATALGAAIAAAVVALAMLMLVSNVGG
jgi:hypothetical protein